ncbi:MAG: S8 family serine peptidase, partial [Actinomycetota bacterium]
MTQTLDRGIDRRWSIVAIALVLSVFSQFAPAMADLAANVNLDKVDPALVATFLDSPSERVSVIVGKSDSSDTSLETAVTKTGGSVLKPLFIVNGFEAVIPARSVPDLAADPNLRSLSVNRTGTFESVSYDAANVASSAPKSTGAMQLWAQGNLGAGVGIAVIDTGISPMNDFNARGVRLVHGPDLSGEGSTIDSYGHGTVMAGIIAGDGYDSASSTGGAYVGQAPEATLISVKVAGANGAADVSTVLAAMHWVAAYRDQYNIRVMNLSWGTESTQSYKIDPLNYAVERLWQLGITVVVSAGNGGPNAGTINKPGDDPFVITVGGYDDKGNTNVSDDTLPQWTSRGPTLADGINKPDVVAPGRRIIGPRSYGSTIERENPKALYAPSYIRGSGSSQAAAAA